MAPRPDRPSSNGQGTKTPDANQTALTVRLHYSFFRARALQLQQTQPCHLLVVKQNILATRARKESQTAAPIVCSPGYSKSLITTYPLHPRAPSSCKGSITDPERQKEHATDTKMSEDHEIAPKTSLVCLGDNRIVIARAKGPGAERAQPVGLLADKQENPSEQSKPPKKLSSSARTRWQKRRNVWFSRHHPSR